MVQEQLYASFMLDRINGLEIALKAESVSEATPVARPVKPLPACVDYVEGFMQLRDEVIPLVNLKKRLGLSDTSYEDDAKVAVVRLFQRRYGLLVDDIREVFGVHGQEIEKLDGALQTSDKIIGALIKLERGARTVEVLDLNCLFKGYTFEIDKMNHEVDGLQPEKKETRYIRYIVFTFAEQLYGLPAEYVQEITFFDAVEQMYRGGVEDKNPPFSTSIKDIFKHGDIDGILILRGRIVPVLNARHLLTGPGIFEDEFLGEDTRVLVLNNGEFSLGMIVEEVKSIEMVPEDRILTISVGENRAIRGVYQQQNGDNILLLQMDHLVGDRRDELISMYRLGEAKNESSKTESYEPGADSHHLITENSYLIFSIGKFMAVQLKDVQEILEDAEILTLPGAPAYAHGVINLRGLVVPVVNVSVFIGDKKQIPRRRQNRLIICRAAGKTVALEVDSIVTIYKQEKYQSAGSLNPDLARVADTLDRLIVFDNGEVSREHVLVMNVHNLIRNHLDAQV